jgi:hypothetical protein
VLTGRVSVSVTVTTLAGSVSVTAGTVSVTVAGGTAGASVVVSRVTAVSVSPPIGDVVVPDVVRVRPGSVDVMALESPPPPLPQPAVASATARPSNAAAA